jgi:hypothetical protein
VAQFAATHIAHPGPNRLTLESRARETSLEQSWFQGESPKLRCGEADGVPIKKHFTVESGAQ